MEIEEKIKHYETIIKLAKEFIDENSHEFICKRDNGLPELEFDDNVNASDLIGILEGNY